MKFVLLVLGVVALGLYEVPDLVRNRLWRELSAFAVATGFAFTLALLMLLGVSIPILQRGLTRVQSGSLPSSGRSPRQGKAIRRTCTSLRLVRSDAKSRSYRNLLLSGLRYRRQGVQGHTCTLRLRNVGPTAFWHRPVGDYMPLGNLGTVAKRKEGIECGAKN
jgi:hypothetical protein